MPEEGDQALCVAPTLTQVEWLCGKGPEDP